MDVPGEPAANANVLCKDTTNDSDHSCIINGSDAAALQDACTGDNEYELAEPGDDEDRPFDSWNWTQAQQAKVADAVAAVAEALTQDDADFSTFSLDDERSNADDAVPPSLSSLPSSAAADEAAAAGWDLPSCTKEELAEMLEWCVNHAGYSPFPYKLSTLVMHWPFCGANIHSKNSERRHFFAEIRERVLGSLHNSPASAIAEESP